jgi:hypothetical protein
MIKEFEFLTKPNDPSLRLRIILSRSFSDSDDSGT